MFGHIYAHKQNNSVWMTAPQFGAWDQKGRASPNYSMVFGQAHENGKQSNRDVRHLSLENDIISHQAHHMQHRHHQHHPHNRQEDDYLTVNFRFLSIYESSIRICRECFIQ
ncbi:hypothetical protein RND81_04G044200 [Saponaria officinalis]|uniref:RIN4 pathogenic type III effector avirulence factor Avr cleavage site domain-containing protein n=1 Tax=Saponaria officinalis TaxID=3572 RepID=A0AAW1LHT7_SAPOF